MAVFFDPSSGKKYANVPEKDAETASSKYGLVPEEEYQLQQSSGSALDAAANIPAEAGRKIVSGGAALLRGVSSLGGEVDAMGNPTEATAPALDVHGQDIAPALYTPGMMDRRAANPISTAIGGALPAVAANIAAPGTGLASIASAVGISAADAASQEATDADIEGRGINGEHILRNAALESIFTAGAMAIPAGTLKMLDTGENIVRKGAGKVIDAAERFGKRGLADSAEAAVADAEAALASVPLPKIASNPNSQRDAIETLSDSFMHGNPVDAKKIEELVSGNARSRFAGLQSLEQEFPEGEVRTAVGGLLKREDLWGKPVIDHMTALEASAAMRPQAGFDPAQLSAYANSLRGVSSGKVEKAADLLDELAQKSALQPLADAAPAMIGGIVKRGAQIIGGKGGWLGYMIGTNVGDALAPLAEKAAAGVPEKLVAAAQALKTFAENDQRMTGRLLVDPEAAASFGRVIGTPPTAIERFQGDDVSLQQAFTRQRATLQAFAQNPTALIDQLDQHIGSVGNVAPELHRQMTTQALNISAFLQQKLPPARGVSVARPDGTPASPLEMRQFALYATAAVDPSSVMADARAGRLRKEQVDTLQALWPSEYQGLRMAVIEQLGQGSTTVTRQRMNLLFGFGSSIDPALGPKITAMVNAARDASKQGGQSASPPGISSQALPSAKSMTPGGLDSMQLLSSGGR